MKYLILLLLISFSALADVKIEISNLKGKHYKAKFEDQLKADAWMAGNIANDSWGKKERWELFNEQTTCLETREIMNLVDDISIPYPDPVPALDAEGNPVLDEFGNPTYEPYTHPQVEIVDHVECKMPVEYTIVQTDITQEVADEKAKKDKDASDCAALEVLLQEFKNDKFTDLSREELNMYLRLGC